MKIGNEEKMVIRQGVWELLKRIYSSSGVSDIYADEKSLVRRLKGVRNYELVSSDSLELTPEGRRYVQARIALENLLTVEQKKDPVDIDRVMELQHNIRRMQSTFHHSERRRRREQKFTL